MGHGLNGEAERRRCQDRRAEGGTTSDIYTYADPSPTWRGSEETIVGAATVALEIRSSVQPMFVDRVEINDIQARVALLIPFTGPRKLPG